MNRAVTLLLVLIVLNSAHSLSGQETMADREAEIKKKMHERRETLQALVNSIERAAVTGRISPTELITAINSLLEVELQLAETQEERIAINERRVSLLTKQELLKREKVKSGVSTQRVYLEAKQARLEAEIDLLRAGGKLPESADR